MKSLEDLLAKQKDQVKKKMMHLHVDGKKNIFFFFFFSPPIIPDTIDSFLTYPFDTINFLFVF